MINSNETPTASPTLEKGLFANVDSLCKVLDETHADEDDTGNENFVANINPYILQNLAQESFKKYEVFLESNQNRIAEKHERKIKVSCIGNQEIVFNFFHIKLDNGKSLYFLEPTNDVSTDLDEVGVMRGRAHRLLHGGQTDQRGLPRFVKEWGEKSAA